MAQTSSAQVAVLQVKKRVVVQTPNKGKGRGGAGKRPGQEAARELPPVELQHACA